MLNEPYADDVFSFEARPPETIILSAEAFRYMTEKDPNHPRYAEFMEYAANCPPGQAIMMTAETIQYWSGE